MNNNSLISSLPEVSSFRMPIPEIFSQDQRDLTLQDLKKCNSILSQHYLNLYRKQYALGQRLARLKRMRNTIEDTEVLVLAGNELSKKTGQRLTPRERDHKIQTRIREQFEHEDEYQDLLEIKEELEQCKKYLDIQSERIKQAAMIEATVIKKGNIVS